MRTPCARSIASSPPAGTQVRRRMSRRGRDVSPVLMPMKATRRCVLLPPPPWAPPSLLPLPSLLPSLLPPPWRPPAPPPCLRTPAAASSASASSGKGRMGLSAEMAFRHGCLVCSSSQRDATCGAQQAQGGSRVWGRVRRGQGGTSGQSRGPEGCGLHRCSGTFWPPLGVRLQQAHAGRPSSSADRLSPRKVLRVRSNAGRPACCPALGAGPRRQARFGTHAGAPSMRRGQPAGTGARRRCPPARCASV